MAGKLVYSRVLQNRLAKGQNTSAMSPESPSGQQTPAQHYYSSASSHDSYPAMDTPRRSYDHREQRHHHQQQHQHHHRSQDRSHDHRSGYGNDDARQEQAPREGNKIRRGPGRRIIKEKRMRNMDPALMQKYASLPESLQEKVNATIEICYQQHMANPNRNQARYDASYYDQDIQIDTDTGSTGEQTTAE